jgi:2-succinyl-5-enolpyruvyl-6-hydroxy-3-cyclohexene-1-carboxylate synthase
MAAPALRAAASAPPPSQADDIHSRLAAFADELVAAGVEHVCLCPGARSTPLTVALARTPGLRAWSQVDERSAAFFALGIAKATRRPAAVVCTSGTAAANFFPAVIEAAHARVPLLVLTADRPPELRDRGTPQTIDQIKLYGGYPRWFAEVGGVECGESYFRNLACRAAAVAAAEPAGPVHLNFPFREPLVPPPAAPGGDRRIASAVPHVSFSRARLDVPAAALLPVATRIAAAPRGLILCGPADNPPAVTEAISALARATGYPIIADAASQMRNGAHDRTLLVDTYEALLRNPSFAAAHHPQLVLRFGPLPTCKPLRQWLESSRSEEIVVDASGSWDDPLYGAVEHWQADPTTFCRRLEHGLGATDRGSRSRPAAEWSDDWLTAGRRAGAALAQGARATDMFFGGRVFAELADILSPGTTLYVGNSMPIRELELFWPAGDSQVRILCNRGANGIDGFVSSGLGAAASSGEPVVIVTGDLGFYHDMNGLLVAKRYSLPALIIVLNNDGGGIFARLPQRSLGDVFDEYFTTPHGLDFARSAQLYDCAFARPQTWAELRAQVRTSLAAPRASIVEVSIDDTRARDHHDAILRAAAEAID